ncbi:MAG: hypothetical protein D6758_08780 [Gammaproteobacteria bacterium]|nr:MAG: hypothetical protein D6758_08780 [Gammaproteobacteria bacterium]
MPCLARLTTLCLTSWIALQPCWAAPAEESNETGPDSPKGWLDTSLDWLINQRNNWSQRLVATGRSVDGFLANTDSTDSPNHSYVKLSYSAVWKKSGIIENSPKARFKLDLPLTNKRFRLVVENEPADEKPAEQRLREATLTDKERTSSPTEGRLSASQFLHHWKWRGEIGLRIDVPADPFVRLKAKRHWQWPAYSDAGGTTFESSLFYTHIQHLGQKNSLTIDYPFGPSWLGRAYSEALWDDDDHRWTFVQSVAAFYTLDAKRLIENRVAWLGESRPSVRTTDYLYQFRYRQKLYKDWFFLQIVPEALWSRDEDWDFSPSLSVGFEIVFSE